MEKIISSTISSVTVLIMIFNSQVVDLQSISLAAQTPGCGQWTDFEKILGGQQFYITMPVPTNLPINGVNRLPINLTLTFSLIPAEVGERTGRRRKRAVPQRIHEVIIHSADTSEPDVSLTLTSLDNIINYSKLLEEVPESTSFHVEVRGNSRVVTHVAVSYRMVNLKYVSLAYYALPFEVLGSKYYVTPFTEGSDSTTTLTLVGTESLKTTIWYRSSKIELAKGHVYRIRGINGDIAHLIEGDKPFAVFTGTVPRFPQLAEGTFPFYKATNQTKGRCSKYGFLCKGRGDCYETSLPSNQGMHLKNIRCECHEPWEGVSCRRNAYREKIDWGCDYNPRKPWKNQRCRSYNAFFDHFNWERVSGCRGLVKYPGICKGKGSGDFYMTVNPNQKRPQKWLQGFQGKLFSPIIQAGSKCISFNYYLNGGGAGELRFGNRVDKHRPLFVTRQTSDMWRFYKIQFNVIANHQLFISYKWGQSSDFAVGIDNWYVTNRPCWQRSKPPPKALGVPLPLQDIGYEQVVPTTSFGHLYVTGLPGKGHYGKLIIKITAVESNTKFELICEPPLYTKKVNLASAGSIKTLVFFMSPRTRTKTIAIISNKKIAVSQMFYDQMYSKDSSSTAMTINSISQLPSYEFWQSYFTYDIPKFGGNCGERTAGSCIDQSTINTLSIAIRSEDEYTFVVNNRGPPILWTRVKTQMGTFSWGTMDVPAGMLTARGLYSIKSGLITRFSATLISYNKLGMSLGVSLGFSLNKRSCVPCQEEGRDPNNQDNDCDGWIGEDPRNEEDDDNDGLIDEDSFPGEPMQVNIPKIGPADYPLDCKGAGKSLCPISGRVGGVGGVVTPRAQLGLKNTGSIIFTTKPSKPKTTKRPTTRKPSRTTKKVRTTTKKPNKTTRKQSGGSKGGSSSNSRGGSGTNTNGGGGRVVSVVGRTGGNGIKATTTKRPVTTKKPTKIKLGRDKIIAIILGTLFGAGVIAGVTTALHG